MKHRLKKLILGVFSLSEKLWNIQDYHKKLQTLPFHSGELGKANPLNENASANSALGSGKYDT
jgi:hypothetical protein